MVVVKSFQGCTSGWESHRIILKTTTNSWFSPVGSVNPVPVFLSPVFWFFGDVFSTAAISLYVNPLGE